ncbi:hypothetical protein V6N13_043806 [Hibiscus sabdariffa]|uniref:Uncharacterized protein n=1 Tax=Hibiscus sabdariffa TaxID=183260 RepID=A0ABR2RGP7_9ROSI
MSIEALAMAGVDYEVCGIEFEVWEHEELEQPPPYLLAEPNPGREGKKKMISSSGSNKFSINQLLAKAEMVELVQIMDSMNRIALTN